ncbi:hypothetical protein HW561_03030 [Rhodobacteraceae bacterium B1Z28]|uniref:Uncharacterized protein n=1 Tax=Ruegeria haliotis TaxID=2747601 RepID=A0ABX2PKV8_9RHOB|nr:hypothetical protein [Ruegeria haliotis]NVO54763.1 hypothetical protein [Ruegeria haliotis]
MFIAKQPPLSRLRLDRRLKALTPEDANVLDVLEHTPSWSAYDMNVTDSQAIQRCKQALREIPQPTLRKLFMERMEIRSVVAALRLRQRGEGPPSGSFGVGRWGRHIPANWSDPSFRLETPMPWINEVNQLLDSEDPLGLERLLLSLSHTQLKRHAARHTFDFEAVAIYVLIWNIFNRWAQSSAEEAAKRFEKLAQQAMANVADIDFEGVST